MQAIVALPRVAACARLAPVAGARHVVEIGATCFLHKVAADRRRVAKLRRGAGEQRLRDGRIGPGEALVVGEIGIADHRADAHAAVVQPFDAFEAGQAPNVDETGGAGDADFHQIDDIGAGREKSPARLRGKRNRLCHSRGPDIIELVHAASFRLRFAMALCASRMASVMP